MRADLLLETVHVQYNVNVFVHIQCALHCAVHVHVVWDLRNGSERWHLKPFRPASTLQAAMQSAEMYALAFKCAGLGEGGATSNKVQCILRIDMYEARSGRLVRYVAGCPYDVPPSGALQTGGAPLQMSGSGSYAFTFASVDAYEYSEFAVFNLDSNEHRHTALHGGRAAAFAGRDMFAVLSSVRGDSQIRIWNVQNALQTGKPNAPPKMLSTDGGTENVPIVKRPKVLALRGYPSQVAVVASDSSVVHFVRPHASNESNHFRAHWRLYCTFIL